MEEKKEETAGVEASKDPAAAAELAKIRSSNKLFKAAAIVLFALFALLLSVVLFMYQRFSGLRDLIMPPSEILEDPAFRAGEAALPGILPEGLKRFAAPAQTHGGSALTVFTNAGDYARAASAITPEDGIKTARAFAKYADRPLVKDFLAELKKDPDFARALKEKGAGDPLAMIASLQNTKNMHSLALRFAMRKDFVPLMMEVMNDPEMKPLLQKLPMGNMLPGGRAQMMTPASVQPPGPAPAPALAPPEDDTVPEAFPGEPALLDNSVMRSPAPSTGTGLKKKTPPVPGD